MFKVVMISILGLSLGFVYRLCVVAPHWVDTLGKMVLAGLVGVGIAVLILAAGESV